MSRTVGTVVRGIRTPIIREGDDVAQIVATSVLEAAASEGFAFQDRDVVAATEAIVARAQGNYASVDAIATDMPFQISRRTHRRDLPHPEPEPFRHLPAGASPGARIKSPSCSAYPSDEVGNHLFDPDELDEKGVNPWTDVLDRGNNTGSCSATVKHTFTGVDYVEYYTALIREEGAEVEVLFSNNATTILTKTPDVLACDIHTRNRTKRLLKAAGAKTVYGLDDILSAPVDGSGYNASLRPVGLQQGHGRHRQALSPATANRFVKAVQDKLIAAHRQANRGHGLRRRRLQGSGGQNLGAGRPGGLPRLYGRAWRARPMR